jgi:hypothetical protein
VRNFAVNNFLTISYELSFSWKSPFLFFLFSYPMPFLRQRVQNGLGTYTWEVAKEKNENKFFTFQK